MVNEPIRKMFVVDFDRIKSEQAITFEDTYI